MIDDMKPGPELDKEAARLLGINEHLALGEKLSTTWEGMRLVVEEMQRRGLSVFMNNYDSDFQWSCNFRDGKAKVLGGAYSHTAPHAVVLAALAAIKAIQGEDKR